MPEPDLAWPSLALSVFIGICALALAAHLLWERSRRGSPLPAVDRKHFLLQDLRRSVGIALMVLLGAGIYLGARQPLRVIVSATERHPNRRFLLIWLAVFATLIVLLGLAIIDWIATRRYAHRHREALNLERIKLLGDIIRRAQAAEDGQANGSPFPSA
jgi:hypothetical protein